MPLSLGFSGIFLRSLEYSGSILSHFGAETGALGFGLELMTATNSSLGCSALRERVGEEDDDVSPKVLSEVQSLAAVAAEHLLFAGKLA